MNVKEWVQQVIKPAEIEKYLVNGKDFIDEKSIFGNLENIVSRINSKCGIFYRNLWI